MKSVSIPTQCLVFCLVALGVFACASPDSSGYENSDPLQPPEEQPQEMTKAEIGSPVCYLGHRPSRGANPEPAWDIALWDSGVIAYSWSADPQSPPVLKMGRVPQSVTEKIRSLILTSAIQPHSKTAYSMPSGSFYRLNVWPQDSPPAWFAWNEEQFSLPRDRGFEFAMEWSRIKGVLQGLTWVAEDVRDAPDEVLSMVRRIGVMK